MALPGDVLLHPTTGQRLIFRRTAAQTGGRVLEFAVYYRVGESSPPEHRHVDQEHQVEVLEGRLLASLRGRVQSLGAGDVLLIPAGEPHAVWNASSGAAHAVWYTFPARDAEVRLEAEWLSDGVRP